MSIINWNRGLLMAPNDGAGAPAPSVSEAPIAGEDPNAGPPQNAPVAPPQAPPAPAPVATPPPDAESISMSSQALKERMERDRSAYLKKLGFDSEEELVAMQRAQQEAAEAEEQARREQQTREQNLQEDLLRREQERDQAIEELHEVRFQNHVTGICARLGVKNVEYATFEIERAAHSLPEGEQLDVEEWLSERLDPEAEQHAGLRNAFGVEAPVTTSPAGATTTSASAGSEPTPPKAGPAPTSSDAMSMDDSAWAARKASLGIG